MSKSSDHVKKWRKTVKEISIKSMGGQCQICGYNKCYAALELHHLDPSQKELTFSFLLSSCRNWNLIYNELKKCILLCANCHQEVHSAISTIPKLFNSFDENLANSLRSVRSHNAQKALSSDYVNKVIEKFKNKNISNKNRLKIANNKKKNIELQKQAILNSTIEFNKRGWVKLVAAILSIKHQKVNKWMKLNMLDFYVNNCYKRK